MKRLPSLKKHVIALSILVLMFMFLSTVQVQAKPGDRYQNKLRKQANKNWTKRQKKLKKANRRIAKFNGHLKTKKGFEYVTLNHANQCPTGKCNKPK